MVRELGPILRPRRRRGKPRILICTPEITELPAGMGNAANYIRAKGGGLGDISAGLIRYLHDDPRFQLHVVLPKYDAKITSLRRISPLQVDLLVTLLHRQGVHLVTDSAFSQLEDIYGDDDAHPRVRRAGAYQRFVINHLLDDLRPDVVHCNDWMTGLIPAAAADKGIRSLMTIHNIFTEYQTPRDLDWAGIDVRRYISRLYFQHFPHDDAETWNTNRADFLATGVMASDIVNTVSRSFLAELVRGDHDSFVPQSVLQVLREKFEAGLAFGIVNAPNDSVDPRFGRGFDAYDVGDVLAGKARNKEALQLKAGLRVDPAAPLFFWPNRLYAQKGPELLAAAAPAIIRQSTAQLLVVANGEPGWVDTFRRLARDHPGSIVYRPFEERLAELARAGSDFVLMPSRYEPCGLPQLEGPRFGTLPVVRATGGLRDTVEDLDADAARGNGFVFEAMRPEALLDAMRRAVTFRGSPDDVRQAQLQRVMRQSFARFSLENTAREYIRLYERLLDL
jgi:ADP-glucose type glycogen/starch synthase